MKHYVKITKRNKRMWYADVVGELFEVCSDTPEPEGALGVFRLANNPSYIILKEDCEVVEKEMAI